MALVGSLCFCEACGNLLDRPSLGQKVITCEVCETRNQNVWPKSVSTKSAPDAFPSALQRKKHTEVLELSESQRSSRAKIKETCPVCSNPEMEYHEVQLRSADEGSTIFYHCLECHHRFNTNN